MNTSATIATAIFRFIKSPLFKGAIDWFSIGAKRQGLARFGDRIPIIFGAAIIINTCAWRQATISFSYVPGLCESFRVVDSDLSFESVVIDFSHSSHCAHLI